ncbi:MAG: aminotransferase class I/II-fold pyridoxal phosphate-dependent enzyme [Anaerolineaceae bacterium]|nr:aminotransferase class I/II-fold pyridoxal phosphate-dependent enzyme [Anaerolineaceae bacterium]MCB9098964.1 aminotransferase class I/II-fold pyridoxal phosphate-dependent enzyme [Anaerolineales bacterium]
MTDKNQQPQNGLSRHYNASQLRTDTWNNLKQAVKHLEEKHKSQADTAQLREQIQDIFDLLEPIESYWAFPGKEAMQQLETLFERHEYHLLTNAVNRIVRMLVSDSYRYRSTASRLRGVDGVISASHSSDERPVNRAEQHYFEVLFVDNLSPREERDLRRGLLACIDPDDKFYYDVVVVPSFEDALIAVLFNHNIQGCVIRYSFPFKSKYSLDILQQYISVAKEIETDGADADLGPALGEAIKKLRPELDLYLVLDSAVEDIALRVYKNFRRVFYRQENLELHLSLRRGITERYEAPFFSALKAYSQRPTGVFHAMPISRGNSIFKSHWIQDIGQFYGHNIFLAETSATTGGLDSLLQPTGPLKKAQEMASRAFGSQHTFFVTNGTSTANKIVTQALLQPGDIVLIDRDCHKSHHYGMVLSGAHPVYLDSYPVEKYSMYGAVPLREIKQRLLELKRAGRLNKVKMLLLTNCTFDGLVYNVERVMEEVLAIKPDITFLWDEAWFGFAAFTPTYRQRTAMKAARRLHARYSSEAYRKTYAAYRQKIDALDPNDDATWLDHHLLPDPDQVKIRAYSTQSTHKKLTSLRQGSMIHIHDEEFNRKVEDTFHEAYMTHTSTSPNYQILASLDVGRRQVELEGYELVQKSAELAMTLRAKITEHPLLRRYFAVLSAKDLIPKEYRPSGVEQYYDAETGWSRMEEAWHTDDFVLDPTHITLYTGQAGIDGDTFKNRYLMDQFNIQVNKTSRNSVLFMTNIGTTRSSVAFLISVLLKIAQQLDHEISTYNPAELELHQQQVKSLTEDLPPLPDFSYFHAKFRPNPTTPEGDMRAAYFMAYNEDLCEYLKLDGTIERAVTAGREVVSASFIIPYPPGFPILVPGQVISQEILDFLKALDVKEIHGYRPSLGLRVFTEAALAGSDSQSDSTSASTNGHPAPEKVIAATDGLDQTEAAKKKTKKSK